MTPCSPLSVNRRFGGTHGVDMFLRNVGWQLTTRRYIPGDNTFHNHCCENLKSYRINSANNFHFIHNTQGNFLPFHSAFNTIIHTWKTFGAPKLSFLGDRARDIYCTDVKRETSEPVRTIATEKWLAGLCDVWINGLGTNYCIFDGMSPFHVLCFIFGPCQHLEYTDCLKCRDSNIYAAWDTWSNEFKLK
jgi:hypothetical protein